MKVGQSKKKAQNAGKASVKSTKKDVKQTEQRLQDQKLKESLELRREIKRLQKEKRELERQIAEQDALWIESSPPKQQVCDNAHRSPIQHNSHQPLRTYDHSQRASRQLDRQFGHHDQLQPPMVRKEIEYQDRYNQDENLRQDRYDQLANLRPGQQDIKRWRDDDNSGHTYGHGSYQVNYFSRTYPPNPGPIMQYSSSQTCSCCGPHHTPRAQDYYGYPLVGRAKTSTSPFIEPMAKLQSRVDKWLLQQPDPRRHFAEDTNKRYVADTRANMNGRAARKTEWSRRETATVREESERGMRAATQETERVKKEAEWAKQQRERAMEEASRGRKRSKATAINPFITKAKPTRAAKAFTRKLMGKKTHA